MPSNKRKSSSSSAPATPTKFPNNFHVLPIQFPPQPSYPHPATHHLYIRPDADSDSEDARRSLFVANVPITASEENFRKFFKTLSGAVVQDVQFSGDMKRGHLGVVGEVVIKGTTVGVPIGRKRKRRGDEEEDELVKRRLEEMELPEVWGQRVWESGSSAVVRFVDVESKVVAWKAVKKGIRVDWPEDGEVGLDRYRTHQRLSHPSSSLLKTSVNAYLSHFATLESLRSKQMARQRNVPDEEGFVTVVRGGRTGPARLEDAKAAQERLKERAEKRVGGDFYRFQSREARKKREGELKRKFEEDRKRLGEMRGRRNTIPEV